MASPSPARASPTQTSRKRPVEAPSRADDSPRRAATKLQPSGEAACAAAPPRETIREPASAAVSDFERRVAASGAASTSLDKLGYCWDQTEHDVRIYLSLAAVASDDVRCAFSGNSCALTAAVGQQRCVAPPARLAPRRRSPSAPRPARRPPVPLLPRRSFFFEIKRTFAPIDPALSLVRFPRSKRQVALKLRKREVGVEWPALRCIDADVLGASL